MVTPMPPAPVVDPTAVFGRRVAASAIDGIVVIGPWAALAWSQVEYRDISDTSETGSQYCKRYTDQVGGVCTNLGDTVYYSNDVGGTGDLLLLGLSLAIFVILQGLTGWTIGKRLLGLRCVRADGRPPGIGKALLRWVLWLVDGLPCFGLVGFITGLSTVGHRRVGDMAAHTYVVRADAAGSPVVVPAAATAGNPPHPTVPPPPPPHFPTPTAKEGPQWDEARGTYIQWDPTPGAWMQWDDASKTWLPIR